MTLATHVQTFELAKAGVEEPLAYSTQQQGASAGAPCTTILVGEFTGRYYCAEEGCSYTSEKWTSVFAHRSGHGREAKAAMRDLSALAAQAGTVQLSAVLAENFELRTKLEAERNRRVEAEKRILRVRRAVA